MRVRRDTAHRLSRFWAGSTQPSGRRGFTLVEALVALTVLALAAVTLLSAQGGQARTLAAVEAKTLAQIAAENALLEAMIDPGLTLGIAQGAEQVGPMRFEWERRVAQTGLTGVMRVHIQVRLAGGQQVLADLTGLKELG